MKKTALLVIDVQNGIFNIPDKPVADEQIVLKNINYLISRSREEGVPVIFVQHNSPKGILKYQTKAWEIHPDVVPFVSELRINKQYADSFQDTTLRKQLDILYIDTLIIAGLQTEYCVDTTCRRAYSLGFEVILASDAHSTVDGVMSAKEIIMHHNDILGNGFAQVKESRDII